MSEFDWSAWQQADETKEVALDGGRVALIRPVSALKVIDLLGLPVSIIMNAGENGSAVEAAFADKMLDMSASELLNVVRDVVVAGCVQPRIATEGATIPGECVAWDDLGETRAMALFGEIMALTKLTKEDAAQAGEFRSE